MKTAIFLGAGASKAFGYPLTAELLPRMLTRLDEGILFEGTNTDAENAADRKWFSLRLFGLMPGLRDAWDDVVRSQPLPKEKRKRLGVSVTDLLTLIDRALVHGEGRAVMSPDELGRFRLLFERGIYEALMRGNDRRKGAPQEVLDDFTEWLRRREGAVSVLTTNYDTAVDGRIFEEVSARKKTAEEEVAAGVDVGFPWRRVNSDVGELAARPAAARWQILKLHGSVNWLHCPVCGQIYMNVHGAVATQAFRRDRNEYNLCHCNDWVKLRLHLVTPSLVRQTHDAHLLGIWQAGLEAMRTAEEWVIVGYSLPAEDVSIRSLFLRAWDGHATKPRITVVQRENPETESVYRAFFPRENLVYRTDGLEGFLREGLGKG